MKSRLSKICNSPHSMENLTHFAKHLRNGSFTCQSATNWYLDQISSRDAKLKSFVHVDRDRAQLTARKLDQQLADGRDLGPLMGVPITVKDLISVDGMPTKGGSRLDTSGLIESEGSVVRRLRDSGCILLGKNRTIELAAGAHNLTHPTPWNPCDLVIHHTPGGSSNGSAVSVAADLCMFSLGTDTGGSVRLPAAMCSQFGFKPTQGLWPTNGVIPLSPELDTLGLITRSATDAAIIYGQLSGTPTPLPLSSISGVRLGVPINHYFENLDAEVADAFKTAVSKLKGSGIIIEQIKLPETEKVAGIFSSLVAFDLLKTIGRERFQACQYLMDPVLKLRLSAALKISEQTVSEIRDWLRVQRELSAQAFSGLDGFISPTSPILPRAVSSIHTPEQAADFTSKALQNTRPANVFNYCAASIPTLTSATSLPVGLQLHKPPGQDSDLLSLCQSIETLISP